MATEFVEAAVDGSIIVAGQARGGQATFRAIDPSANAPVGPAFAESGMIDVADACAAAQAAAPALAALSPDARAAFLEACAEGILAIGDNLVATAMRETGLPRPRLEGERMRTVNQLRLFAGEVRRGEWLDVTIDTALPERAPPRPDLRRLNVALGPVAVFGASNFPLAFSVAGGDTASALAAGCPVVVRGHPAHPATGEMVARAIVHAAAQAGLPGGVFSFLPGTDHSVGAALVADPRIMAVGFTGSRNGGLVLARVAAARPVPVPFYGELSAINPVVILPGALARDAEGLAAQFVASLTMGAGQFCTNPGLVLAVGSPDLERFVAAAGEAIAAADAQVMLSPGIARAYEQGLGKLAGHSEVELVASGPDTAEANRCRPALLVTSGTAFMADEALAAENFGASALVVRCADQAELLRVIDGIEGQLTATLHHAPDDEAAARTILPHLTARVGRVLANGWPTGVEVCHAMVHGGPFPATTDARTTSVGTLAMRRFMRPVCYQAIAPALLPAALADGNPWNLPRTVNGERE